MKVAGADVWKGQWVVVVLDDDRFDGIFLARTIDDALDRAGACVVVGVDIPIGLPNPGERRPADQLARTYVGPRWQTVFVTPSLDLLEADTHAKANQLAVAECRAGISAQTYALGRMIRQVQPAAARDHRIHEVHPEVSFVRANADIPLPWSKSSWNGINLRRRILERQRILLPDELSGPGTAGFADVLDAAIVAWSAGRIAAGRGESLPLDAGRIGAIWS